MEAVKAEQKRLKSLWSQEKNSSPLMQKRRDAFPSQLIYSLYIKHPNKKSVSCVLHCKEFKMMLQCFSHISTMKSYKTFTRAGKQNRLGSLFRWKKYTNMMWCRIKRPSLRLSTCPLTNTQPHIVNMFILLKGKHSSVGFSRQGDDEKWSNLAVCAHWMRSQVLTPVFCLQHIRG